MLAEFGAFPAVIDREVRRYLPFLATTKLLVAAVGAGVGRETAHEVIKEHAVATALAMREVGDTDGSALLDRLATDPRLGLTAAQVRDAVGEPLSFTGLAQRQVATFADLVAKLVAADPAAAAYQPGDIL